MKKLWIVVAVIIVLLIAGVGYMQLGKSTKPTEKTTNPAEKPKTTQENVVSGTLKSLLLGGKTQTCTIIYPNNEGTGTVYVSDKKFSGDFTIKGATGTEIKGHTVSDGTYVYIWSSATPTGVKMKITAVNSQPTGTPQQGNVDLNRQVNLKCTPGVADSSKFTIPTNIQFMDISNFAKPSGIPVVTGTSKVQTGGTSPCESITNATAKAACENAVKNAGQ